MNKRSLYLSAGLALLALASVVFVVSARQESRAEESILALAKKRAALEAEGRRQQAHLATVNRRIEELRRRPAVDAHAPAAASGAFRMQMLRNPIAFLVDDPRLQAAYFAAKRANLPVVYGPFYKALHLSAEQIQRFEEALMEREEHTLDILAAVPSLQRTSRYTTNPLSMTPLMMAPAPSSDDPTGAEGADARAALHLYQEQQQTFQAAANDVLGADGYQQLSSYERSLPVRDLVNNLAGQLAASPTPLTAAQSDGLTQILAGATPSFQQGGAARPQEIDWSAALPQAKAMLTPQQYQALNTVAAPNQLLKQLTSAIVTDSPAAPATGPHS